MEKHNTSFGPVRGSLARWPRAAAFGLVGLMACHAGQRRDPDARQAGSRPVVGKETRSLPVRAQVGTRRPTHADPPTSRPVVGEETRSVSVRHQEGPKRPAHGDPPTLTFYRQAGSQTVELRVTTNRGHPVRAASVVLPDRTVLAPSPDPDAAGEFQMDLAGGQAGQLVDGTYRLTLVSPDGQKRVFDLVVDGKGFPRVPRMISPRDGARRVEVRPTFLWEKPQGVGLHIVAVENLVSGRIVFQRHLVGSADHVELTGPPLEPGVKHALELVALDARSQRGSVSRITFTTRR